MPRLALVLALVFSLSAQVETSTESIEDFVGREMEAAGAPGISYAVVAEGAISEVGVRGVTNTGTEAAVTPETPFVIGLISKSFTALATTAILGVVWAVFLLGVAYTGQPPTDEATP